MLLKADGIIDALTRRNSSIGAHGLKPLGNEDYVFVSRTLKEFLQKGAQEIDIDFQVPQLPRDGILAAQAECF